MMLLVIGLGYAIAKKGHVKPEHSVLASSYITKIVIPIVAIRSLQEPFSMERLIEFGIYSGSVLLFTLLTLVVGFVLCLILKIPRREGRVWAISGSFSSTVFMGGPLYIALFGEVAAFPISAMLLAFNLLVSVIAIPFIGADETGAKIPMRKRIRSVFNSGTIACIIGLVLFIADIRLPYFMLGGMQLIWNTMTPIFMLVLGFVLAQIPIRSLIDSYRVPLFTAVKLILCPLITFFVFRLFITDPMILTIITLGAAMPTGNSVIVVCETFKNNSEIAAKVTFVSTVLCIVTVPLLALIIL